MTIAEQIIEEARPLILEEGREEGREEGKVELLLKLATRHGLLPKYEQALTSFKTPAELELLEEKILDDYSGQKL